MVLKVVPIDVELNSTSSTTKENHSTSREANLGRKNSNMMLTFVTFLLLTLNYPYWKKLLENKARGKMAVDIENNKPPPGLAAEWGQIGGWEFANLSFPR